jgi:hypothetical protein
MTLQLGDLAPDVFQPISSFISGFDLCRLWLCGDKRLCQLISNSVREFRLVYVYFDHVKWPRFISYLPLLRKLYIHANTRCYMLNVDLTTIPKGVESVELLFTNAIVELMPINQKGVLQSDLSPTGLSLLDLRKLLPNLQLISWSQTIRHAPLVTKHCLSVLPQTLRTLHLNGLAELHPSDIGLLPSNLTELNCLFARGVAAYDWEIDPQFPPNITTLRLSDYNSNGLKYIPRGVIRLDITYNSCDSMNEGQNLDWSQLPKSLISLFLSMPSIDKSLCNHLPPTLKYLKMYAYLSLPETIFLNLPPNLTFLQSVWLSIFNHDTFEKILPRFPRTITEIPYFFQTSMGSETWKFLPPGITRLALSRQSLVLHQLPLETLSTLPRSLKDLDISDFPVCGLCTLPETITNLNISMHGSNPHVFESMSHLSNLQNLTLKANDLSESDFTHLNCKLSQLHLTEPINATLIDLDQPWTRELKSLTLKHSGQMEGLEEWISRLPKSTLQIFNFSSEITFPTSFKLRLPKSLEYLTLRSVSGLTNDHLEALPPKLVSLSLSGEQSMLTAEFVARLPPSIRFIEIPQCTHVQQIETAIYARFPWISHFTTGSQHDMTYERQLYDALYLNHPPVSEPKRKAETNKIL